VPVTSPEVSFNRTFWRSVYALDGTETRHVRRYGEEEIRAVIKGRGVRKIDGYLAMERTGRRTRFGEPLRLQTWDLMQEWDSQMAARGTVDFPDVVLRARDHARRRASPAYRAAIVDEAQDLTLVGLQLVRALVNGPDGTDPADGLLIVGDGAQRIYAGGFSLRQAGVETRGRTTVLRVNYRNTQEIIDSAMWSPATRRSTISATSTHAVTPMQMRCEVVSSPSFWPRRASRTRSASSLNA